MCEVERTTACIARCPLWVINRKAQPEHFSSVFCESGRWTGSRPGAPSRAPLPRRSGRPPLPHRGYRPPRRSGRPILPSPLLSVEKDGAAEGERAHPRQSSSTSRRTAGGIVLAPLRTRRAIASREAIKISVRFLPSAISASRVPPTSRARNLIVAIAFNPPAVRAVVHGAVLGCVHGGRVGARLFHSITSSARSIIDGGMARPSAVAVLRFTTTSNFVGAPVLGQGLKH